MYGSGNRCFSSRSDGQFVLQSKRVIELNLNFHAFRMILSYVRESKDDRDISATIQSVLTAVGYRVFSANNGQDGRRIIQAQKPDLVLTDMMMPRMGGFPVLEFLAEMPDAPPVIMMTANEGSRHKAYAEMLGVVDYLRKPFAMEVMLESVARAIAGKQPS